MKPRKIKIRS